MNAEDVKWSVSTAGSFVTMGALALSGVSDVTLNQDTANEPARSTITAPIFFGEQSANVFVGETKTTPAKPNLDADRELETIFNGLSKNWREATGGYTLTMRRYAHGSYQSILALEPKREVISLILRELQQRPDRWFEALKALAKTNPAQEAKTFDETVQRWIE